jgi:uncharacterized protein YukE
MADYIGMDPAEVETFSQALETKAGDLETIISTLTTQLANTTWIGNDRTRFEENWSGTIALNLRNAADQLHTASTTAHNDAQAQINTSA